MQIQREEIKSEKPFRMEYLQGIPTSSRRGLSVYEEFPPPEPPMGRKDLWDLQFCNWWGWTWVRKQDQKPVIIQEQKPILIEEQKPVVIQKQQEVRVTQENERAKRKPKKKNSCSWFVDCCCSCCESEEERVPERKEIKTTTQYSVNVSEKDSKVRAVPLQPTKPVSRSEDHKGKRVECSSEVCIHSHCCNHHNNCCCCCMHEQMCCHNTSQDDVCCSCNDKKVEKELKTVETQTEIEVEEVALSTSVTEIPKERTCNHHCCHVKKCCTCKQNPCCSCRKHAHSCNPCTKTREIKKNNYSERKVEPFETNAIVNNCLIDVQGPQYLNEFLKFNKVMYRPVDLLLSNNCNLMKLLMDNKLLLSDIKDGTLPHFFDVNDSLNLSGTVKSFKSDQEHCRLLTAVCDAILSNKNECKQAEEIFNCDSHSDFKAKNTFKFSRGMAKFKKLQLKIQDSTSRINKDHAVNKELRGHDSDTKFEDKYYYLNMYNPNIDANIQTELKLNAEAGVQAKDILTPEKVESSCQTNKFQCRTVKKLNNLESKDLSSSRPLQNRTLLLKAPIMTKTGIFCSPESSNSTRGFKRSLSVISNTSDSLKQKFEMNKKPKTFNDTENKGVKSSITNSTRKLRCFMDSPASNTFQSAKVDEEKMKVTKNLPDVNKNVEMSAFDEICEKLVTSINLNERVDKTENLNEACFTCALSKISEEDQSNYGSFLQTYQGNFELLDAISPPFTDLDGGYNTDKSDRTE